MKYTYRKLGHLTVTIKTGFDMSQRLCSKVREFGLSAIPSVDKKIIGKQLLKLAVEEIWLI